jgi:hypothetical protein
MIATIFCRFNFNFQDLKYLDYFDIFWWFEAAREISKQEKKSIEGI